MGQETHYTSANLGGIKRGDSAETGDLKARPNDTADRAGSGAGPNVTGDASALGASRGRTPLRSDGNDLDDLTIKDSEDPTLGLTGIGDVPPQDWAADTGPTHSSEADAPSRRR